MPGFEAAKNEIRAIFPNEVECVYETEGKKLDRSRTVIWAREIVLAGMNQAEGMVCISVINYAIYPDGYWEQVGLSHSSDWCPRAELDR